MRTKLNITEGIFPMPVLMVATYNEDGSVNVSSGLGLLRRKPEIRYKNDLGLSTLCLLYTSRCV